MKKLIIPVILATLLLPAYSQKPTKVKNFGIVLLNLPSALQGETQRASARVISLSPAIPLRMSSR